MAEEEDDQPEAGGTSLLAIVMPFATALVALGVGVVVGGVVGFLIKPAEVREVSVPRDLTLEEIEGMCRPSVQAKVEELDEANARIASLTAEAKERSTRVADLEAQLAKRGSGGGISRELEAARAELAQVKMELETVKAEKARLEVELRETVARLEETEEALEEQKELTTRAKEDALTNKWLRFLDEAQLDICERGNRKKLGNCRETVQAKLGQPGVRDKFAHCVRSKQATPSVHELERGGSLPTYSVYIDQEDKITKDWYLQLCDPTLPEADGFLDEDHLPKTTGEFDDLPD